MANILKLVKYTFNNYPIISNSIIYGTLFVGAEFSQQTVTKKILKIEPTAYDHQKLVHFGIIGFVVCPPVYYYWYRWLDKKIPGTTVKIVLKKLLIDQFLFTPNLLIIFYVAMSILEQKPNLLDECKQKFIPTFKNSCLFWLPVQSINFLLIPSAFRVVYVGTCSFAWINILCWMKRQQMD